MNTEEQENKPLEELKANIERIRTFIEAGKIKPEHQQLAIAFILRDSRIDTNTLMLQMANLIILYMELTDKPKDQISLSL